MKKLILGLILTLGASSSVLAQLERPISWSYRAKKTGANEATLYLKASLQPKWHVYALHPKPSPTRTFFTFVPSKDYKLIGATQQPKPTVKYDQFLKANLAYFEKEVVFEQKIRLNKKQTTIKGKVEFMVCSDKSCLPSDELVFSIPVN
ncbi:protein-disulfide reductase DsbD domain-containing protein [Pedobacter sp. KR3-3]|uniref:Protein-disulfide reductase DsbD domain-containing protein n=1 Tax=Pedobacter albus TaxID=3113905 RepID=A0ABU7ICS4_9SPHI|nr:protein-disulfide reductase DsbD domain-containing protein [Pedobacter sp. KR3-3]MEE1947298.1 protein-disulfide reductase DsbD domain-containing protein [Pedobacter sp. KR3-3]